MNDVFELGLAHLRLVLIALGFGVTLGVPLGVLAVRHKVWRRVALGGASLVQTIPGLALLAIMVPAFAATARFTGLRLPSIGVGPALVALVLYALLPIMRGVVVGVQGVDRATLEAARGVGMSPREQLLQVELPLALPSIVSGIRTATVWTVGMATLATPVGATSLGNLIFAGLQTRSPSDVALGCAAAAVLALLLDGLLANIEAGLRVEARQSRRKRWLVSGLALAVVVVIASVGGNVGADQKAPSLRIGAKTFTEQFILAGILESTLNDFGRTEVRASLGSSVVFDALASGDLDVYVEYTGTLWTTLLKRHDSVSPPQMRAELERRLRSDYDVHLLAALGFENAYALLVRGDESVQTISQLAPATERRFGGDYEFFARPEWVSLQARYGLAPLTKTTMDPSLLYDALRNREVDVIAGYTTDGRIDAFGLRVLSDDRNAIPPYDAVLLASGNFVRKHPRALLALQALEGKIDDAAMRSMNGAVDRDGLKPAAVARRFLRQKAAP